MNYEKKVKKIKLRLYLKGHLHFSHDFITIILYTMADLCGLWAG